jgi:hypothetical protein
VQRDRKHAAGIGALAIQHIEGTADHVAKLARRNVHAFIGGLVVGLLRIGHRDQAAAAVEMHDVGLVVVAPVAHISAAFSSQQIERLPGFLQPRTEPALRPGPGGTFDGREGAFDDLDLLTGRRLIQPAGVAFIVAHPFPFALVALLDDDGMVVAQ